MKNSAQDHLVQTVVRQRDFSDFLPYCSYVSLGLKGLSRNGFAVIDLSTSDRWAGAIELIN